MNGFVILGVDLHDPARAAIDSCKHLGEPWEWPSNYSSSELWNALVVPLSRHVIKGVVWYQGEQNRFVNMPSLATMTHTGRHRHTMIAKTYA